MLVFTSKNDKNKSLPLFDHFLLIEWLIQRHLQFAHLPWPFFIYKKRKRVLCGGGKFFVKRKEKKKRKRNKRKKGKKKIKIDVCVYNIKFQVLCL